MRGWTGVLLRVNLSTGLCRSEEIDPNLSRDFLGGRGLAAKVLFDEGVAKTEPLGPDNKLIFASGPLSGTVAPGSGRYTVVTKSPLTGGLAFSNSGGHFPAELKFAGYDMVIIEGKAEKPSYLWISDDSAEIRSAEHLWGRPYWETEDLIKQETSDEAKVAGIGPAGENLVLFASIQNDKQRAAGRSGVGAVMGSKNLKAIAVRGTKAVGVADVGALRAASLAAIAKLKASPFTGQAFPTFGTSGIVNVMNAVGSFPSNNFQQGNFPKAEGISGEVLHDQFVVRHKGCISCPVGCSPVYRTNDSRYKGAAEGPEYENLWALGAACGVDDLPAVLKANNLCNDLGLDTISMGLTIACAMELYEKGLITVEEAGIPLTFGSAEAMVTMVEKTAAREGFGDILAEGSARMAKKYGRPELSMTVKGQELAAYDLRALQGMGLHAATSNRGGDHSKGYTNGAETFGVPMKVDPTAAEGKGMLTKIFQDLIAVIDSIPTCLFYSLGLGPDDMAALLEAATGAGYTVPSVVLAGERIWNIERLFNLRAGFTMEGDTLPKRLLEEPIPAGPTAGQVSKLSEMLPEYYAARGWDPEGRPTPAKLVELGLNS
ncbi:MAG: aldehyde ferredoxin oxidoreductase [Chloroflexota bacterium]|nr:MAG: aldehyde ferredoxin oxidoreductase [Chloroflexota bacterium]